MLPPQLSIGLAIHEAAGTNRPYIFLISQQVMPAGELASHASLNCRKRFKSCKFEGVESCVSLHGNSILGKCAMTVIVNQYFTTFFHCADQCLGDLNLYSFFILAFLKGDKFLSVIFRQGTGNKWTTHTIMSGLERQIFQASSNRVYLETPADSKVRHTEETGFVTWMITTHGSVSVVIRSVAFYL